MVFLTIVAAHKGYKYFQERDRREKAKKLEADTRQQLIQPPTVLDAPPPRPPPPVKVSDPVKVSEPVWTEYTHDTILEDPAEDAGSASEYEPPSPPYELEVPVKPPSRATSSSQDSGVAFFSSPTLSPASPALTWTSSPCDNASWWSETVLSDVERAAGCLREPGPGFPVVKVVRRPVVLSRPVYVPVTAAEMVDAPPATAEIVNEPIVEEPSLEDESGVADELDDPLNKTQDELQAHLPPPPIPERKRPCLTLYPRCVPPRAEFPRIPRAPAECLRDDEDELRWPMPPKSVFFEMPSPSPPPISIEQPPLRRRSVSVEQLRSTSTWTPPPRPQQFAPVAKQLRSMPGEKPWLPSIENSPHPPVEHSQRPPVEQPHLLSADHRDKSPIRVGVTSITLLTADLSTPPTPSRFQFTAPAGWNARHGRSRSRGEATAASRDGLRARSESRAASRSASRGGLADRLALTRLRI